MDFARGDYDLVLFHVKQFLQLYLKYLLYEKIRDYPKTNSVARLVRDLIKVYESNELQEFLRRKFGNVIPAGGIVYSF